MARLLKVAGLALFAGLVSASGAQASDSNHGLAVFRQQCSTCHSVARGTNSVGPSLAAIVGRAVASAPGFHYSSAMKAAGGAWTSDRLRAYLQAPAHVVPGNHMPFGGLHNDGQLDDLIAYLKTLH